MKTKPELEAFASAYIVNHDYDSDYLDIVEYFDDELDHDEAREVLELILTANVAVSW